MSEADFYSASAGQYRGSKYPGFTGGTTDSQGNVVPSGSATNVGASVGANQTPTQVQQQQTATGNTAANTDGSLTTPGITMGNAAVTAGNASAIGSQTPSTPSFGGEVAQTALPAVGNIFGTGVGNALATGASFGSALGAGGEALQTAGSNLASGNIGGLLGLSSGVGSTAASSGAALGSTGVNAGTSFVGSTPSEGINFVSDTGADGLSSLGSSVGSTGADAAVDAGASGAGSGAGAALGAGLSGIGTFAADLLSGESLEQSAISGVGAAAGGYIGGALAGAAFGAEAGSVFPGIGTVIGAVAGSLLGSLFGGGGKPSVGPDGGVQLSVQNGQLETGSFGGDNGFDAAGFNTNVAQPGVAAINKILTDNNLQINAANDPYLTNQTDYKNLALWAGNPATVFSTYNTANIPETPLQLWNYLVANNMIESKTPMNQTANNLIQGSGTNTASTLKVPGSITANATT